MSDSHFSADIVEGMVNKGIFLNGDNGGTFLHFGNYQNSCISDPTFCGPEGESRVCITKFAPATASSKAANNLSLRRHNPLVLLEKPRG